MCIMLYYHNHENISYANLICINVLKILIKRIIENKIIIKKKKKKKKQAMLKKWKQNYKMNYK